MVITDCKNSGWIFPSQDKEILLKMEYADCCISCFLLFTEKIAGTCVEKIYHYVHCAKMLRLDILWMAPELNFTE